MKHVLLVLWTLVLLGVLNVLVWKKERTAAHGRTVLLELAPRDPRSLMQGDYMVLTYRLANDLGDPLSNEGPAAGKLKEPKGLLVLKLDERGVAKGLRQHDGGALAADEQLLVYRNRNGLQIGAESFFFQEGQAETYARARYGELKVDAQGQSVLIGLRDDELKPLGQPVIR